MLETQVLHPSEETLERFSRNEISEAEVETIETHLLACEACLTKLEDLQSDTLAWKLALNEYRCEKLEAEQAEQSKPSKWNWFSIPKWSWAAACGVLALGVFVSPAFRQSSPVPAVDASLSAMRGGDAEVLPVGRPVHLQLNAFDLQEGKVQVGLFDERGDQLWKGQSTVRKDKAEVSVPAFSRTGSYFVRIFAQPASGQPDGELLREFAFQVK